MSDLSRWQFLEVFTALEASALICGASPEKAIFQNEFFGDRILGDVVPVYKRISSSYGDARFRCVISLDVDPAHLQSVLLCNMRELAEYQGETSASSEILNSSDANLDKQEFSRIEIARWLKHHNFNSAFKFDLDGLDAPPANPVQSRPENNAEKPLATRERDALLTIIAVLCKEAKLDYTKHSKTAGLIRSTAAGMGVSIGETTIENHLKKIPNALEARMK